MSTRRPPPSPELFTVFMDRRLDWSELDSLGHANNARYFTWFEEARMAYFISVGIPATGEEGWGPILAHTSCDFLAPVHWPAQLHLGARVTRIGSSSLTMEYAIFVEKEHERGTPEGQANSLSCVARGEGVVVLVHYATGDKVKIQGELRARLESTLTSGE